MKYEIKIISEEDTIKSKPYEDLDKAIEIADKMFNDFVNTDFGDEVVVVEENSKDKEYLWANGKKVIEELKVGNKVRVIDNGKSFTTYLEFMTTYGTKEQCCLWDRNVAPQEDGTIYEILNIADHLDRNDYNKLAIIQEVGYCEGKVYIIEIDGLKKVNY